MKLLKKFDFLKKECNILTVVMQMMTFTLS